MLVILPIVRKRMFMVCPSQPHNFHFAVLHHIDAFVVTAYIFGICNPIKVITKIVLPLSFPGILTGITMTFVPAVSTFVISGLLGGSNCFLIGDLIQQQFLGNEYNLNYGAATSLMLIVVVFISMGIFNSFDNDEMEDSMV